MAGQRLNNILAGCTFRLRKLIIGESHRADTVDLDQILDCMGMEELSLPWDVTPTNGETFQSLKILQITETLQQLPILMASQRKIEALSWRVYQPNMSSREQHPGLSSLRINTRAAFELLPLAHTFPSIRFLRIDCSFHVVHILHPDT